MAIHVSLTPYFEKFIAEKILTGRMSGWSFSPEAYSDLLQAWIYWDQEAGASTAKRPVRFWLAGNHWVVYRAETEPLEIVRLLRGARDVPRYL